MSPKSKLWIGAVIAIICGLCALPFILLLPFQVYTTFGEESFFNDMIGLLFTVGIFTFGFTYGLRLRKRGQSELKALIPVQPSNEELKFTSHLTLNEYRYLIFTMLFSSPFVLYMVYIGMFLTITAVLNNETSSMTMWFGVFFMLIPFGTILASTRTYNRTPCLKERISGSVTVDGIELQGQTYKGQYQWSAILKLRELSGWFLLYTGPQVAILLNKKTMEVNKFRAIVSTVPGLTKDLKSA